MMQRSDTFPEAGRSRRSLSLGKLAVAGVVLAFLVIVFGAFVRLSDAGLGCPDWPGCYGQLTVPTGPEAFELAAKEFPRAPLQTSKAWIEMAHRYLAGILGLVILAITLTAWRSGASRTLPGVLLVLVIFQALLGMWTVTLLLKPAVVVMHLLGGMATLGLLVWLAFSQNSPPRLRRDEPRGLLRETMLGLAILVIQIALGGWVSANYAGLACTDFPLCQGEWAPAMNFQQAFQFWRDLGVTAEGKPLSGEALLAIQWTHRLGALITATYLTVLGLACLRNAALRTVSLLVLMLTWAQVTLGVANVLLRLPLALAVAHNAAAALLLISVVVLNFKTYRGG